jgi:hypothetical protein
MPTLGQPVGQNAYQSVVMKNYANAWNPFVRTVNRYCAGPNGTIAGTATGTLGSPAMMPFGGGRRRAFFAVGGNTELVLVTAGGTGYTNGDTITMAPINGGRPIVVKVTGTGGGGAVTQLIVVDPGSGLVAGGSGVNVVSTTGITVVQASSSGGGTGATFVGPTQGAVPITGFNGPVPNPAA